eukprot:jgi/Ulvmu1/10107/UM006_0057.1
MHAVGRPVHCRNTNAAWPHTDMCLSPTRHPGLAGGIARHSQQTRAQGLQVVPSASQANAACDLAKWTQRLQKILLHFRAAEAAHRCEWCTERHEASMRHITGVIIRQTGAGVCRDRQQAYRTDEPGAQEAMCFTERRAQPQWRRARGKQARCYVRPPCMMLSRTAYGARGGCYCAVTSRGSDPVHQANGCYCATIVNSRAPPSQPQGPSITTAYF